MDNHRADFQEQKGSESCKALEAGACKCRFVFGQNRVPVAVAAQRFSAVCYSLVVLPQGGKVGKMGKSNGFTG